MANSSIEDALDQLLSESPGSTARVLAPSLTRLVGGPMDKSTVNRTLYGNPARFRSEGKSPPRWFRAKPDSPNLPPELRGNASIRGSPESFPSLWRWQQEALDAWRLSSFKGVVEAVTGTGKTRVGMAAAHEEFARDGRVLVIVPTIELQRQWAAEFHKLFPTCRIGTLGGGSTGSLVNNDVVVGVVNSVRSRGIQLPREQGLLLADECHRYGSDCNKEALNPVFPRRLGLSATYARSDDGHLEYLNPYFGGTCYSLGYSRAIADGIVARFKVALIAVSFSDDEKLRYDEADARVRECFGTLVNRCDVPADPFGQFMKEVTKLASGPRGPGRIAARGFTKAFSDRRAVLAETDMKFDALIKLIPAIEASKRTLVFTETKRGADFAAQLLNERGLTATSLHSDLRSEERRARLAVFSDGRIRVIVAPRVLDEGIDVPEADLAIIMAASKTRRQMIQRMGRVLRLKQDSRRARFAILFVEGTNEDPQLGAHGEFLEQATAVADEVGKFDSSQLLAPLLHFLALS